MQRESRRKRWIIHIIKITTWSHVNLYHFAYVPFCHFLKRKQNNKPFNITQKWHLKLLLGKRPWTSIGVLKCIQGNFSMNWWRKICFVQYFSEKRICLLCINFRGNFLKYLLCVGVKSECSKRPQRVRLDRCCQQHDHKKSCNWPIINTELQKTPMFK